MMCAIQLSHNTSAWSLRFAGTVFVDVVLNTVIQMYILYFTMLHISNPAVKSVQEMYRDYHETVWPGGNFSQQGWDHYDNHGALCEIPFSQPRFFLVMLAVWTSTCFVDLKDTGRYLRLWWGLGQPSTDKHVGTTSN